ncbi:glycoside hydrolase family 5 protein [Babjeviella inositovora NRRL Y-12698]|uniref:Glycoside hydrolase family 5 protein n=1 Tax=Babjeviella inositovora NRRL Y-12698 TaxID=984486 RepID=A0A1E3QPX5_9ASCO|nr:glycoside hydrolase family 5 protein [Babjeviella inositovora NRRL Y-12698]ODQ79759.1 glycoside hydrolase family 5 protein [Babjeviella inositovora NRRL Y-12698]
MNQQNSLVPDSTDMPIELLHGRLGTDQNGHFTDRYGRRVLLRGVNLDASAKLPTTPDLPSYRGGASDVSHPNILYEGDTVSFLNRPFPLNEAATHFRRIKSLGFNVIRYIVTWEALEHSGPGIYDEDFITFTIDILKIAQTVGGLYVFMDMHQDVWSRFSGGSGAPMWTLYAVGLEPRHFSATEASVLHCEAKDPKKYTKMVWSTNYFKLAAATMFTLFFGGKVFAPKCIMDGVNIQDYLQLHFNNAVGHMWQRIVTEAPGLIHETIIGFESLNEPSCGFIGVPTIAELPKQQKLKLGLMPTAIQAMVLGMGSACTVDEYEISIFGPKKKGSQVVDPRGTSAWVTPATGALMDAKYGFQRDPGWDPGCLYALHGVWEPRTGKILRPDYFSRHPTLGARIDEEWFINNLFVDMYKEFKRVIRDISPDVFLFCQPPVMQIPPNLVGTGVIDSRTVYAPHYYDGMSLMFKTWNRKYNVDTLGILRGRYMNPALGIVMGEANIRKCIKRQFSEIRKECEEYLGFQVPVMFTETGMPFDMDDKQAYDTSRYESQTRAWDALGYAIEGNNLSVTFWSYCSENNHKWGDNWNNEDFSIWSQNDQSRSCEVDFSTYGGSTIYQTPNTSVRSKLDDPFADRYIQKDGGESGDDSTVLSNRIYSRARTSGRKLKKACGYNADSADYFPSEDGIRAIDALARPYPVAVNGKIKECEFDLESLVFDLKMDGTLCLKGEPSVVYVPSWHFREDEMEVQISSGKYEYNERLSTLEWYHDDGEQTLQISRIGGPAQELGFGCGFSQDDCIVM